MNIEIKEKVENCPASSPMWHNPLDNVIEKYDTMAIQASDIMFERGIDGDPALAERCLQNWMDRHRGDFFHVGDKIKISITRRGEDLANRKIHSKHQKKYRVMK